MFKFRLKPLLDHRKRQEEEKQRELALINRDMVEISERIAAFSRDRGGASAGLDKAYSTARNINTIRLYEDYIKGKDGDILWAKREGENIHLRLLEKQKELAEYVKRRRVLEVYRDRLKEEYEREEKRKERIALDEMGSQMYFREAL